MFDKSKGKPPKLHLENEQIFYSFQLKRDRTLNLTDSRLVSSHNAKLKDEIFGNQMGIQLKNIQMITPIRRNTLLVQFTIPYPKPETEIRLKHEYVLKNDDAVEVADKLKTSLTEMFSYVTNDESRLLIKKEPIMTISAQSKNNDGTLYVTSTAIYFESQEGLTFMLPFTMYERCTLKQNTLILEYAENNKNYRTHYKKITFYTKDIQSVCDIIVKLYNQSDAKRDKRIKELEKKFSKLTGSELKKILTEKRKDAPKIFRYTSHWNRTVGQCTKKALELVEYVFKLAEKKFGSTRPTVEWCYCSIGFPKDSVWGIKGSDYTFIAGGEDWCTVINKDRIVSYNPAKWYDEMNLYNADYHFIVMEARLVLCALLADVPLEKLGDHTDSYLEMIKEFQKDFDTHRRAEMDYVVTHVELKRMKAKAVNADDYKRLLKESTYAKYRDQYKKCKQIREQYYPSSDRSPPIINRKTGDHAKLQEMVNDVEFSFTDYHWKKTYAKRMEVEFLTLSRRIYDEWKKDIALENFTDDSDYSWVDNVIANYPYPQSNAAVLPDLKSLILNEHKRSECVKKSLESFCLDGIPKEDITNNDCWYDGERKMWFSLCEKASLVASVSSMRPDETKKETGYAAFGFAQNKVTHIHGFPAVEIPFVSFPVPNPNLPYVVPPKNRYVILTAIPSSITKEMMYEANCRVSFVEDAPYTQTIKEHPGLDKTILVRNCENAKKSHKFKTSKFFPITIHSPILEFDTIDPEIGIMNSGMMIDNSPTRFERFLYSSDGLIRDGMIRGVPASSDTADSPLNVAVRINAERLDNDYPAELLPLYERLRRHLFSVITLCGVLTKPNDISDVAHEFNSSRSDDNR